MTHRLGRSCPSHHSYASERATSPLLSYINGLVSDLIRPLGNPPSSSPPLRCPRALPHVCGTEVIPQLETCTGFSGSRSASLPGLPFCPTFSAPVKLESCLHNGLCDLQDSIDLSEPQYTLPAHTQFFDLQTFTSKGNGCSVTHHRDGKMESSKCKVTCWQDLGLATKQIS